VITTGARRIQAATPSGALDIEERPRCAACDHDLHHHDAISHRYCQATQAHALPRKCICQHLE
jgi:hypothetical protein